MAKKILIIEDEQDLIKALRESFNSGDYEIEVAHDGKEGIEKIKSFKPDLVLLDLILPQMDGFSVLRELQEDTNLSDTRVMVLTNLSDVSEKVSELGALDCLIKADSSIDDIHKKIETHLL